MESHELAVEIGFDRPLNTSDALEADQLGRLGYAESAVRALARVNDKAGFVLSVEGAWGSGKTSTLAMMEALLRRQAAPPVIVHFNPWLVGDRDSLLRHFLAKLAAEVQLSDRAVDGKNVARELKAYGKVFDLVKLIPGAEPWASIVKSVIESASESVDSVAGYKTPDLDAKKEKVAHALRKFSRRIVVFIDDIDRLFPIEVFEIIRIVKAIGDLPNVGYVLAWDPGYVCDALLAAQIPRSGGYIDKVVQLRLPLPAMSLEARSKLINVELARLHPDAHQPHFLKAQERLGDLYLSGLRDLLEQPRDFVRVFNTVSIIEPALRGEVVLADIIGFAALMVKAPAVYELLRKEPSWFVGRSRQSRDSFKNDEELANEGTAKRDEAIGRCDHPRAVRSLVRCMFPLTSTADEQFSTGRVVDVEGHISAAGRLLVALQLHISGEDVSFVLAHRYLRHPEKRPEIAQSLAAQNCIEFIEYLGDVAQATRAAGVDDVDGLCVDLARLSDTAPFYERSRDRSGNFFHQPAEIVALTAIWTIVKVATRDRAAAISERIVCDPYAITVAVQLFATSYLQDTGDGSDLRCSEDSRARLAAALSRNALDAARDGRLLSICNPGLVLWRLSSIAAEQCPEVLAALQALDPTLDRFAVAILGKGYDSVKGLYFSLPDDRSGLSAYWPIETMKRHADQRLSDPSLQLPARAAWRAVVDGKKVYALDGTYARA